MQDTDTEREEILAQARELDATLMLISERTSAGPGAYERTTDLPLTVALDIISGHGMADAESGSVDTGAHGARVGRFILWTDDQGFMTVSEFDTEERAQAALTLNTETETETVANHPLVLKMAEYMLDDATSASELHEAVELAVDLIEAHPHAASVTDLEGS